MGDYFKEWQRKSGVVALVLACLFAGLWVRGAVVTDRFRSCSWIPTSRGLILENGNETINSQLINGSNSVRVMIEGDTWILVIASIPHWIIVVPLTVLAANLLLLDTREEFLRHRSQTSRKV